MSAPSSELYRERLTPSAGMHVISLVVGGSAFFVALPFTGEMPALATGLVVAVAVSLLLVRSSPVVSVVRGGDPADGGAPGAPRLRAGGAVIPVEVLGAPAVLDDDGLRRALGTEADARAYVVHRGWVHGAVRLPVEDPRDATPYWLICTRRPAQLVAALGRR
ncbi:DUF3093 domain-containing protein [Georgenia sp. AZ-5]|uniref:DUF3093 domain-containing protein n=1 Tax=Georgenia sp. AZ-5 TaxID=3367526 RepID=UPI00375475A6